MKKQFTILATAILMMATITNATVWRVSNRPNMDADFSTLQDAINGASGGDTLYISGSTFSYGNGVFDKKLVLIGAGYWLEENDTTQAYKENSQVGKLTFNSGSEGSVIEGLYLYYSSSQNFNLITINVDSITIMKNSIYAFKGNAWEYSGYAILIIGDRSKIIIRQNWINARIHTDYNGGNVYGICFDGIPTNSIVSNNFIRAYRSDSSGDYYAIFVNNNFLNDLLILNNVLWGTVTTYYTEHINNILISGTYINGVGNETYNNICDLTQYPDINNNQRNVDMSTIFVDHVKYIDNGYLLSGGSSAIGAGFNGGDCGVFSFDYGGNPYVLSGLPAIPAIFEATIPVTGTSSLPVNIKATTHNANK